MVKLNFNVDEEFSVGTRRLESLLGFERGDGITVTAQKSERIGVSLNDGSAIIYYREKHHFFRELGVLVENALAGDFEIFEDCYFNELSTMLDVSRGSVLTVDSVKMMLDHLALMGYGMMMLYTEDLIKLENYQYFGYMRGRYDPSEIRMIDDYANDYGIELVPCIECYGHMERYLFWPEAAPIRDTERILLAREEKTFTFLDELIRTASGCVRSKRIHIGMDEAQGMGRGKFLDKHGYVDAVDLFNEYMERLVGITDKYGLKPMMWSDMYFRACDPYHRYYAKETEISEETKARIPKNIELVYWHYGEEKGCDNYMMKKHAELDRKIIYAGSTWSWSGHFPEHHKMMDAAREAITACRGNGIRDVMETIWSTHGESPIIADLFGLSFLAELIYRTEPTEDVLRSRFETCSGGCYDAFLEMEHYYDTFADGEFEAYSSYSECFRGKAVFWQDIMMGLYDSRLYEKPLSKHYAACGERMHAYSDARYSDLYEFTAIIFDYLALKSEIAEQLVPVYKSGSREELRSIAANKLPRLKELIESVHSHHRTLWHKLYKPFGWEVLDIRYAGVSARCDTAMLRIGHYLDGKLEKLEELEEPRLDKKLTGFISYLNIANPGTLGK